MHFIVTAIGSAGDINPMLMIACELQRRGHEVDFIANGYFEEKVKKAGGVRFHALGGADLYQKAVDDPDLWNKQKSFHAVWRTLKEGLKLNLELIEKCATPDSILVGSSLAFAARMYQELHGNKYATIHLSPSIILSGRDPMAIPGLPFFSKTPYWFRNLLMTQIDKGWLDGVCRDDLNALRSELGLPPVQSVMRTWMHSPDLVIGAFPSWFAAPQSDWPPNTVTTGFPVYDRPEDRVLEPELEKFLNRGAPPAVFTAGSAMAQAREHFATAIEAAKLAKMRAVLVTAYPEEQIPDKLPADIMHVRYAPFNVLYPRAAIVQHHGGIGTSAQGLAAGVPQIVTPFAHDQFDNAHKLERLGVAKELNKLDPHQWAKAIVELTGSARVIQACSQAKKLMTGNPLADIADKIESLQATAR